MAASTGPILAAGGVVIFNAVVVQGKAFWPGSSRVIVGTAIAAAGLSLLENALPRTAVALAWLSLTTVLLVRVNKTTPSPAESFEQWYNNTGK